MPRRRGAAVRVECPADRGSRKQQGGGQRQPPPPPFSIRQAQRPSSFFVVERSHRCVSLRVMCP
jgi:hypothetical protein